MIRAHDVHAHYYPPEYVAAVRAIAPENGSAGAVARAFLDHRIIATIPTFLGALDTRLRLMDAAGIEIQVLSFASLNIWHPDAATRSGLVRAFNDGCAAVVDQYPDRFRLLASLPLPHVEESVAEAHRARSLPGFVGYSIPTHIDIVPINAAAWEPVYRAMADRPALVMTHPDGFCAPGALSDFGMEWAIGAPFEDTIAAVRLLASGLLECYPALTWVIPHLGGTLPFLLHRLRWRWQLEAELLGTEAHESVALDRLLFETANCSAETLALAAATLPEGRIVFGTDFPFVDATTLDRPVELVRARVDGAAILRERLAPFLHGTAPTASREGR
jgi:predicted TIM-barrel fold metal-dependent hydrolase